MPVKGGGMIFPDRETEGLLINVNVLNISLITLIISSMPDIRVPGHLTPNHSVPEIKKTF